MIEDFICKIIMKNLSFRVFSHLDWFLKLILYWKIVLISCSAAVQEESNSNENIPHGSLMMS